MPEKTTKYKVTHNLDEYIPGAYGSKPAPPEKPKDYEVVNKLVIHSIKRDNPAGTRKIRCDIVKSK